MIEDLHLTYKMFKLKFIRIAETKHGNLAIACQNSSVIVVNKSGKIILSFGKTEAMFTSLCCDSYGNILIAEYKLGHIYSLTENGFFFKYFY